MRVWWFFVGMLVGAWGTLRVLRTIGRARTVLTPANLVRSGALTIADILDAGGERLVQGHR